MKIPGYSRDFFLEKTPAFQPVILVIQLLVRLWRLPLARSGFLLAT